MRLDALIIADSGTMSVSGSSPMRFTINGRSATIQTVRNFLDHNGQIVPPIDGDLGPSGANTPKLNGIALLSDLLQHGYQAALINDFTRERDRFTALLEQAPRVIIISTTFIVRKRDLDALIKQVRIEAPKLPVIVGGPFIVQSLRVRERCNEPGFFHPNMRDDYLFWDHQEPEVDLFVTVLQGQKSLRDALDRLRSNVPLPGLANTAWYEDGTLRFGPDEPPPQRQAEDLIDWTALPDELFSTKIVPMQASRGCPYRCAFCNFVHDRKSTYAKPVERIVAEMAEVAKRGVKYVWFVDDNFRLGKGDLTATSQAILDAKLDIRWMTLIRADTVENVDFGLLKAAGCHELQLGLESADTAVLKAMNKRANPQIYRSVIEKALAAGINVSAYFLIGHPGETPESVKRTIAFMQDIQHPDLPGNLSWSIYPFILVPLSPIYEEKQRKIYSLEGYLLDWQHATMDSNTSLEAIRTAIMSLDESAPISRDDNLDMLNDLDPVTRKAFFRARLRLAKLAAAGRIDQETIFRTFKDILDRRQLNSRVSAA